MLILFSRLSHQLYLKPDGCPLVVNKTQGFLKKYEISAIILE